MTKESAKFVYSQLLGEEEAVNIVSAMDRIDKEAEAKRRLERD